MAMMEFLRKHHDVELVGYVKFGWHGKSFIVDLQERETW